AADFMRWLLEWQHVAPGAQLHGEAGTLEVVRQLQGFEAPANSWEPQLLASRVAGYDPAHLDRLCLGGEIGWGRLSPHPATVESAAAGEWCRRALPPPLCVPATMRRGLRAGRRAMPTAR